jgi:pyridoxal phosphate enzyme (YggS family)
MSIAQNISSILAALKGTAAKLVAVTKTRSVDELQEVYATGLRIFGENRVQEMQEKQPQLPADVQWHLIGHLQSNKVKYIAPYITMIHSVDSLDLLQEINKHAKKNNRIISCLLQIFIATEETKFGLSEAEAEAILASEDIKTLENIKIVGLMGMASNTDNQIQVRKEFQSLKRISDALSTKFHAVNIDLSEISMGMSGDYLMAIEEGSTLIRVGSALFSD